MPAAGGPMICPSVGASPRVPKNMQKPIWMTLFAVTVIMTVGPLGGCYRSTDRQGNVAVVEPVHRAAVLSVHQRRPLSAGCQYGLQLSNELRTEIRDLTLHFTAYSLADDRLQTVTRQFFGIKPTQQQSVQINFAFQCERIKQIEVGDFGRCMVGELTLRSAQPGSCLDLVDIRQSRYVKLIKAKKF